MAVIVAFLLGFGRQRQDDKSFLSIGLYWNRLSADVRPKHRLRALRVPKPSDWRPFQQRRVPDPEDPHSL